MCKKVAKRFGELGKLSYLCRRGGHIRLQTHMLKPEVITFRNADDQVATVVTDGTRTRSFEPERNREHETLRIAIAYLEARGWSIDNLNSTAL